MARPRKNVVKDQNALLTPDNVVEIPVEEQPYPLPEGWRWRRLSSFADCLDKFRKPLNADERALREGTIPYYGATGQVGWIDDYLTNEHLVLVGEDGAPFFDILKNKSYIIEGKSWVNNHAHILRSFSGKNGNVYLMHYLNIFNYTGYVNGTTRLKLTQKSLNAIPIPIPPIDEQQRVVECIESLFAKLDEAREKAEAVLDGFESRKAAILHKAFTGELTAKWREKNGVSLATWENLTLNDIAEYRKGPFGSSITKSMFVPKGKDTYKVYEQGNAIRKTIYYGTYYISKEKFNKLSSFSVKEGDIIISCAGTIGEIYKLPHGSEEGIINQALMRVRVYDNIEEKFFEYYFSEILKGDIIDKSNGTAIKNIPPFKILKAMPIHLPSSPEQQEIVRILDTLLEKERQVKEAAEEVLERIDLMKKSILAKAFRGELTR